MTEKSADAAPARLEPGGAPPRPRVASAELFRGRREIVIVHHGREYRLFITKADKLILTK